MRITFLIAVLLVSIIGKSQDTLLFMNGKDRLVEYKDTADLKVVYVIKGKEKSSYVENIFAVGTAAGRIYFYKQDTLVDDDYSVEQMEQYQLGLRLARKDFNTDLTAGGAAATGLASAYILQSGFYGWLPVLVYTGVTGSRNPKTSKFKLSEAERSNEFLMYGYIDGANRKKIRRTALAGTVGFVAGVIITGSLPD